jgi:hypothetical protein
MIEIKEPRSGGVSISVRLPVTAAGNPLPADGAQSIDPQHV